jgi:hypothetical protein
MDYKNETLAVLEKELGLKIYASTIFKLSKYLKHWREYPTFYLEGDWF